MEFISRYEWTENRPRLFAVENDDGETVRVIMHPNCYIALCVNGVRGVCVQCLRQLDTALSSGTNELPLAADKTQPTVRRCEECKFFGSVSDKYLDTHTCHKLKERTDMFLEAVNMIEDFETRIEALRGVPLPGVYSTTPATKCEFFEKSI